MSVHLRDIMPADHGALAALRADVELQKCLLGTSTIITEPVTDWIARRTDAGVFQAVVDEADHFLGYVQLSDQHHANRTAWFGICMVPEARGKGFGAAAVSLMLAYAKQEMGLRKVSLKVRADNPAQRLYTRLGFRKVGVQVAEYDSGDAFHDVVLMEHLLHVPEGT